LELGKSNWLRKKVNYPERLEGARQRNILRGFERGKRVGGGGGVGVGEGRELDRRG